MTCKIIRYEKGRLYDRGFEYVMKDAAKKIEEKNDDFLIMCVGETGTGKTNLSFHAMTLYLKEKADFKYFTIRQQDFADMMKKIVKEPLPRFLCFDEANVDRRESMTKFNRQLIKLYFKIRKLNILHWWNNPSADMIDLRLIKERIKGLIYIFTKDVKKPRLYYYYTKDGLLKLYEKHGNLTHKTLRKHAKKFAFFRGWFWEYNGKLWDEYNNMAVDRTIEDVNEFSEIYGSNKKGLTGAAIGRKIGVSKGTIMRYSKSMIENEILELDKDYYVTPLGKKLYYENSVSKFLEWGKKQWERAKQNEYTNLPKLS